MTIREISHQPQLVTPVSCVVDRAGDLWVIESNTHFRPDNYSGPENDRVLRFRGPDQQRELGNAETMVLSTKHTMQIALGPDDWMYLATRREVYRFRIPPSSSSAPVELERILHLDTSGDYPHNGLSGLLMDGEQTLYVGMGENLGVEYRLTNNDDESLKGNGEGGNLFRCRPDGRELEKVATGFWNPFGLGFDAAHRLWVVDNDPDASPPCRLLQVVPGGDYGFQFRFGRAGTSPLIAWNGQLPATLGYAAGTGESPCAVVFHRGYLWVTSWGDNRIERYRIETKDGSVSAEPEVVVQGTTQFRPVGLALAKDGSLYVTDWVDRSYQLHGLGRIWRMEFEQNSSMATCPPRDEREKLAWQWSGYDPLWSNSSSTGKPDTTSVGSAARDRMTESLGGRSTLFAAAMWGLVHHADLQHPRGDAQPNPEDRLLSLAAWHWRDAHTLFPLGEETIRQRIGQALADSDKDIRIFGIRWIAERADTQWSSQLSSLLANPELESQEFRVILATLDQLEPGKPEERQKAQVDRLIKIIREPNRSERLRAMAIQQLDLQAPIEQEAMAEWSGRPGAMGREATRWMALNNRHEYRETLLKIAEDEAIDAEQRADAVMGLARFGSDLLPRFEALLSSPAKVVAEEARRTLRRVASTTTEGANASHRTDGSNLLEHVGQGGSKSAGWRVFFRPGVGRCADCHSFDFRGANVGPDLSRLPGAQDRRRVLESIQEPSKEIGPLYVPWQIVTTDGQVLVGLKLHQPGAGGKVRYLSAQGKTFDVGLDEIQTQEMSSLSIMPKGLCDSMTIEELRDLLSLLTSDTTQR